jgi:lysophospholipase
VAFDWRGQGLADRPQHRRDMGHVVSFDEYREDVAASAARWRRSTCRGPIT